MANVNKPKKPAKSKTANGIEILRNRYLTRDPEMARLVAEQRANMQVAQTIYDLRTKAGMSQRQLARLVDSTASVICRLEDADYEGHSLSMLCRIAAVLDARVEIRFLPARKQKRSA
jgi:ribosome-binding protein aMBF1 (putative translation factor)